MLLSVLLPGLLVLAAQEAGPLVVAHDNVTIDRSCTVRVLGPIADVDANGVVHITADDITVDFDGLALRGATALTAADRLTGIGIVITGNGVTLRNARVAGFKVGIHAVRAKAVVLEHCDVSGNYRQHLSSDVDREDPADWLSPHANDAGEWRSRYGAGIYLEQCTQATVRRCRAREGQNGLILDRVERSVIYDNDFSFLSGWGIALWRSSKNAITRNALDFCVRGYSHGVYNRGQDSAGLLMFEQCSDNVIAENSATHCGDGIFAFAGNEALGEEATQAKIDHTRRGNNDNLIARNDLSYSAAHGLELTFSFGNRIFANRLVGNAICGLWGGYSRDMLITENLFTENGGAGYGSERGGINIEHGQRVVVLRNRFTDNACGVRFWWDADEHLAELPWTAANGFGSGDNLVIDNEFVRDRTAIEVRLAGPTTIAANRMTLVAVEIDRDDHSPILRRGQLEMKWEEPELPIFGETRPIGARSELDGRERIHITEWGPYDHRRPILVRVPSDSGTATHEYRVLGPARRGATVGELRVTGAVSARRIGEDGEIEVTATRPGVIPYGLRVDPGEDGGDELGAEGLLVVATWNVRFFRWTRDPREDAEAWRREAGASSPIALPHLALDFGALGPERYGGDAAPDRFGTLAEAQLEFPAGAWTIRTVSDDGIRVWIDDTLVIDDWTHHAAARHETPLEVGETRTVALRVEHFELDGAATLVLEIVAR